MLSLPKAASTPASCVSKGSPAPTQDHETDDMLALFYQQYSKIDPSVPLLSKEVLIHYIDNNVGKITLEDRRQILQVICMAITEARIHEKGTGCTVRYTDLTVADPQLLQAIYGFVKVKVENTRKIFIKTII